MKKLSQIQFIIMSVVIGIIIVILVVALADKTEISVDDIGNAEKIVRIRFNETERDSMLDNLIANLDSYRAIRNFELQNKVIPSLLFNPLPTSYEFNKVQEPLVFSDYSDTELPDDIEELAYYSIGELAELIRTKQISSVDLTVFFLTRLEKLGPKLECVITLTKERALRQASLADKEIVEGNYRGMLHGIPFGVKDLLSTKDYKTTWGAKPFKDQMIPEDAAIVTKLEEAGAILLVKLSMGALAWGDVWYGGKTRNPWNISKGSSGSSAGSASAVSAGLIPFAIGTETWGSIVSPSTVCGVTGLRPTYGRVSRTGAMALSWSMDKIGPICRNAEDLAIVFNGIYGLDNIDRTLYDLPFNYTKDVELSKLRIGYLKSDFDGDYDFHKNDSLTLKKLRKLGAKLIPVELPEIDVNALSIILSAEAAAAFDAFTRNNKDKKLVRQVKNAWPNRFRSSRFIPAVEYINANRIRSLLIEEMQELMERIDVYLAPSWEGDNLLLTNLTGHPCVVLPNGFSKEGTPTSITFNGKLFDEGTLIAVAKAYQDATSHHLEHPDLKE